MPKVPSVLADYVDPDPPLVIDDRPVEDFFVADPIWDEIKNVSTILGTTHLSSDVWRWTPVPIREWLLGERYLNVSDVIRPAVLEDVCEFLKSKDGDPWNRFYDEAILCEGIGSGKSFKMACISSYFTHLLLCLRNPQKYFNVASSQRIAIMNMCFAGNNTVRITNGQEYTFKQLYDEQMNPSVTAYNVKRNIFCSEVADKCVEAGIKKIWKLTFANGRFLRLSGNHPLLTRDWNGGNNYSEPYWKAVADLVVGDFIRAGSFISQRYPSGFSNQKIMLMAYLLGDSKVTQNGVRFVSHYRQVLDDFKDVCRKFELQGMYESDKGDLKCVVVESWEILKFAKSIGICDDDRIVRIPAPMMQAPENEVVLFLNRLWATYGSVNVGHKLSINFTSASEGFIRDLADLLSSFDIISKYSQEQLQYKDSKATKVYRLSVSDITSKRTFLKLIGRYDCKIEGCATIDEGPHRKFEWTQIEKIVPDGEEMTYDIGVPYSHNLVVNGIVCHNSISERNARQVVFGDLRSKILECKWFNERPWGREDARMPDPECMSELRFKGNISIIAGSSSWRAAVGYSIIFGIIDEAGSYRATDNSDQAEDIYLTLRRRLGSRFENKGAIVVGGSPMYESDFLEEKVRRAKDNPRSFVKRRTLWESKYPDWKGPVFYVDRVNRMVYDEHPGNAQDIDIIPKVDFLYSDFKANCTKAYRDYGAFPSPTIHGFFEYPKVFLEQFNRERSASDKDPFDWRLGRFRDWFKPVDPSATYVIHVDLALTGDACGLAMGHFVGFTPKGGVKVYIDLMLREKGSKEAPIDIARIREYIFTLIKLGFKIGMVTYDGFQSSDSIQILQKKGLRAENLSVDKSPAPYNDFKEAMNQGRIDYYYIPSGDVDNPSASEMFIKEGMRLEEIEGKKIDHPPKGSKDVTDAVCGVVHNIVKNHNQFVGVKVKVI